MRPPGVVFALLGFALIVVSLAAPAFLAVRLLFSSAVSASSAVKLHMLPITS